jgi:hypothetical protein
MGEVMKLIEKLKEMFFERELDMGEKPPLFDGLRMCFLCRICSSRPGPSPTRLQVRRRDCSFGRPLLLHD